MGPNFLTQPNTTQPNIQQTQLDSAHEFRNGYEYMIHPNPTQPKPKAVAVH